jgi:hypothetical protein
MQDTCSSPRILPRAASRETSESKLPAVPRFRNCPVLALAALLLAPSPGAAEWWRVEDQSPAQPPDSALVFQRKLVTRPGLGSPKKVELVWFHADRHTLRVIDNGGEARPRYRSLAEALRENGCLAGCNGGFFHEDREPSGLMIAAGVVSGRFGQGALLSGVILSSRRGNPYLLRRAEYDAGKYGPTDLLQSGPFLVDGGATVRGLSTARPARRTFVLHDGDRWFALGLSDVLTLAELGEILALPGFSPARPVKRALNLDGGTSSGLHYDGGGASSVKVEPVKTVRNFVGIVPKGE